MVVFAACKDDDGPDRPPALSGVEATADIGSVALSWEAPQGGFKKYVITYNPGDGLVDISDINTTAYTLAGLKENTEYSIDVSWVNAENLRSLSNTVKTTTLAKPDFVEIVHEGNLDLLSQADVNAVTARYTKITGRLRIKGDVTDLSVFGDLTEIGANLEVDATTLLANLAGLSKLQKVGNNCWIRNNAMLTSIEGLSVLSTISTYLYVRTNPLLTSLTGLENITSVQAIYIDGSPNNIALTDFCALRSVFTAVPKAAYTVSGNAYNPTKDEIIAGNCSMSSEVAYEGDLILATQEEVDALAKPYTSVTGKLRITGTVTDLTKLANIKTVGTNLEVDAATLLTNLDALSKLQKVANNCWIRRNPLLISIEGLSSLTEVTNNLYIRENPLLTSLKGLENITAIKLIDITVNNTALTDFCALTAVLTALPEINYTVSGNAYNPTKEEITGGACKQ